jgi:hypothetical protein
MLRRWASLLLTTLMMWMQYSRLALKELPASVDRVQNRVADHTTAGHRSSSKRKAATKTPRGESALDETSAGQKRSMLEDNTESEVGVCDATGSGGQGSIAELTSRIYSYLDTLLDDRFQYSPRTVLLQIAMVTKYEEVDELRPLFQRCGIYMQSQEESSSEDEVEGHGRKTSYQRSLVVQEGASEESVSEAEEEEELEQVQEQEDAEEAGEEEAEVEEEQKTEGDGESSSEGSSSNDDGVTLHALMVRQRGQSEVNNNNRSASMLPKRQREVESLSAEESVGSSEDGEVAFMKKCMQGRKKRVIYESESNGSQ